jgi:hypothetical protein
LDVALSAFFDYLPELRIVTHRWASSICLASESTSAACNNLLNLFASHWQPINILTKPLREITLNCVGPFIVDLTGGVLLLAKPLVAEPVLELGDLRKFDNAMSQLGRNK